MDSAAHSTNVWRRQVGHCQRQWAQVFLPLRSVTGAMPGILLEGIGGGVALPLCAEGDKEARGKDRPSAWQGSKPGEGGMALGALRNGLVAVGKRMQEAPELGDERLDQERMRGHNTRIGRQWYRALDGLDARVDDVRVAHVLGAEKALAGSAARQLGGFQGGPWGEAVTEEMVSLSANHCRACGQEFLSVLVRRVGGRTVSPTSRRRCATSGSSARIAAL